MNNRFCISAHVQTTTVFVVILTTLLLYLATFYNLLINFFLRQLATKTEPFSGVGHMVGFGRETTVFYPFPAIIPYKYYPV